MKRATIILSILLIGLACGGDDGTPTIPFELAGVADVEALAPKTTVQVGEAISLTAIARDARGKTITGKLFRWQSTASMLVGVSASGLIEARSPGQATITATETVTGIHGSVDIVSTTPTRIPGSILALGYDTLLTPITTTTIAMVDTARSGMDLRVGIVHVASADLSGGSARRSNWPLLAAMTECETGDVWATENSNVYHGDILWRVDPPTAIATSQEEIDIGPANVTSTLCEPTGSLLLVTTFAGFTDLYRYTPGSGTQRVYQYFSDFLLGAARSPAGSIYVTTKESHSDAGSPISLMTMNPTTFALTPATLSTLPQVEDLMFKGDRLFGFSGSDLVEIDINTGVVTELRSTTRP